jgi:hypothetical protein
MVVQRGYKKGAGPQRSTGDDLPPAAFRPLELVTQLGQIATTDILEFALLEQIPDTFLWVKLRRIARKAFLMHLLGRSAG